MTIPDDPIGLYRELSRNRESPLDAVTVTRTGGPGDPFLRCVDQLVRRPDGLIELTRTITPRAYVTHIEVAVDLTKPEPKP